MSGAGEDETEEEQERRRRRRRRRKGGWWQQDQEERRDAWQLAMMQLTRLEQRIVSAYVTSALHGS